MGLIGKLIAAIEFKAGGDVFHELYKHNPHQVPTIAPEKVQGCELHEGQFGHVGSILSWKYTHEGKKKFAKHLIEDINEEKKLLKFKVIEGDVMELYKTFIITVHVETKGDVDLVTTTLDYEMLNEDVVEHPISLLSYFIDLLKDIENHHVGKL